MGGIESIDKTWKLRQALVLFHRQGGGGHVEEDHHCPQMVLQSLE